MTLSTPLRSLTLAALLAAPAAAQCPDCPTDFLFKSLDPLTDSIDIAAPFPPMTMLSVPQFDTNAVAIMEGVSPADVTLVCVEVDFSGSILPAGSITNSSGATCTANWSYEVQAAIFADANLGTPGVLFVSDSGGSVVLDGGETAVLTLNGDSGGTSWTGTDTLDGFLGTGTVDFGGDGLAFELVTGCTQVTTDFQNAVMLDVQVVYSYCVASDPTPTEPGVSYCFGDGSTTACPCGNESAVGDMQGCLNSTGMGGRLVGMNSASVSADDLTFEATNLLPNQPALLFVADNRTNPPPTFGDGLRCAGGSVVRLGVTQPDAMGTATYGPGLIDDANGTIGNGDTKRFQCWYRNPSGGPCATGFNLSNGYEIVFTP